MTEDSETYLWRWKFDPAAFNRAIRVGCALKGWERGQLASALGVPNATLWRWATAKTKPSINTCRDIALLLGLPFRIVIGYEGIEVKALERA